MVNGGMLNQHVCSCVRANDLEFYVSREETSAGIGSMCFSCFLGRYGSLNTAGRVRYAF